MSTRKANERGQSLVEFSIAITVFLILVMGVLDLGKGVYQYNGVSEAAREIARVTTVHRGTSCPPTCTSVETLAVIGTQKALVPDLGNPAFSCLDQKGDPKINAACVPGDSIRVTINAPYTSLTPLLGLVAGGRPPCTGTIVACLRAVSTVKIQ